MSKIKADTAKLAELAGRKGEQLGAFLALLSPDVALQLATALERDRIAGGTGLPVDAILTGLRPRLRELPADVRRRIPTPQRLFFEVVDGMITDTAGDKSAGRIARRSLDPIWRWLLAADARLTALRDELAHQVLIGDPALVPDALKAFDAIAGETIRAGVKKAESKEKTAKEVIQSVGGQRAFEDMRELGRVLQISDEIRGLRTSLPPAVDEEDEGHLSLIRQAFERCVAKSVAGAPYLVLSLAPRVIHPWELFGIAAKLVRADNDQQLKTSELALVGEWLVEGLESEATALKTLNAPDFSPQRAEEILRRFALLQSGMTREVGMRKDGAWGKRLLKTRGVVSDAMEGLFARALKDIQAGFTMRRANSGSRSGALVPSYSGPPNAAMGNRLDALSKFLATSKQFGGQLGYLVAIEKTFTEIHGIFDDYTDGLLDGLAQSRGSDREVAAAWADLTLRVMTPVFSEEAMRILSRRVAAAAADLQVRA